MCRWKLRLYSKCPEISRSKCNHTGFVWSPGVGGGPSTTLLPRNHQHRTSTHRLSVNSLRWLPVAIQAAVHIGGVLPVEPDKRGRREGCWVRSRGSAQTQTQSWQRQAALWEYIPVQVVRGLVQECVILSNKLPPDELGTRLLHHHFFGQMEISEERREIVRRTEFHNQSN